MNLRPKLTEEIYQARIASLEEQVETLKETLEDKDLDGAMLNLEIEEASEKHAKEIRWHVSARNNLILWLKLFFLVLAAVIVGLCVWSGVGYAISL